MTSFNIFAIRERGREREREREMINANDYL